MWKSGRVPTKTQLETMHKFKGFSLVGIPPREAEILEAYLGGLRPGQIAEKLEIARQYVHRTIRQHRQKLQEVKRWKDGDDDPFGFFPKLVEGLSAEVVTDNDGIKTRRIDYRARLAYMEFVTRLCPGLMEKVAQENLGPAYDVNFAAAGGANLPPEMAEMIREINISLKETRQIEK